jgi:hypothetical protein
MHATNDSTCTDPLQGGDVSSETTSQTRTSRPPVIACTVSDEDLGRQRERWKSLQTTAQIDRVETEDGVRIRFLDEAAVERELQALADVESRCCSWADWDISRADGTLVIQVRSSADGVAVLHGMFTVA